MTQFSSWLDEFFSAYYQRRPVNATFIGVHEFDHALPDFSEQGVEETLAEMQTLLARLNALPPENYSRSEKIDRALTEGFLRIQTWEYQSQHFQRGNPCAYTGEAVFSVIALFLTEYAPLTQRVESAIQRIDGILDLCDATRPD